MVTAGPDAGLITMDPPPPMLPALGCVTASAKAVATAASIAFPPFLRIAAPTSEAMAFVETTIPCFETAIPALSLGLWARAAGARRIAAAAMERSWVIVRSEEAGEEVGVRPRKTPFVPGNYRRPEEFLILFRANAQPRTHHMPETR